MRQRAFTLTELLIVIAVIMILMGLLFPIISMVKTQAMRAKALQQLQTIRAACDHYHNLNGSYPDGSYPEGSAYPNVTLTMQQVFLPQGAQGANSTPALWSTISAAGWQAVASQLVICLQTVDQEDFLPSTPLGSMLDPWKTVYRYRPNQYYPYSTAANLPPIDTNLPPNADSVQLWSCGPNTRDDAGQLGTNIGTNQTTAGDDIYLK